MSYIASRYIQLSPDLIIHYKEAGAGDEPIIFIPGWCASSEYFSQQLSYLAPHNRVIAYDPRSHGHSSKTMNGHDYRDHADDLNAFLGALKIKKAHFVCHSFGAYTLYAYVQRHGLDPIKSVVFSDAVLPRAYWEEEGEDWAKYYYQEELALAWQEMVRDRRGFVMKLIERAFSRAVSKKEKNKLSNMMLRVSNTAARMLWVNANMSNYIEEAQLLDQQVPTTYLVADNEKQYLLPFIKEKLVHPEVMVMGNNFMHLEDPDAYNQRIWQALRAHLEGVRL